jgi:hypothetical protein
MQPSIQPLLDAANSIYYNFDCSFMNQDLQQMRTNFCQSTLVRTYTVAWQLILVALLSSLTAIGFYFSTTRVVYFAHKR